MQYHLPSRGRAFRIIPSSFFPTIAASARVLTDGGISSIEIGSSRKLLTPKMPRPPVRRVPPPQPTHIPKTLRINATAMSCFMKYTLRSMLKILALAPLGGQAFGDASGEFVPRLLSRGDFSLMDLTRVAEFLDGSQGEHTHQQIGIVDMLDQQF